MDEHEASVRSARLVADVARARDVLVGVGETGWADWMGTVSRELRAHDAHGLDRLLSAFGGMGSLNDLVISPMNGHPVEGAEVEVVNRELDALRNSMYADAVALRRALKEER